MYGKKRFRLLLRRTLLCMSLPFVCGDAAGSASEAPEREPLVAEEIQYEAGGAVIWRTVYAYDATGYLTEETYNDPDSSIYARTLYEYDETGRKVKETQYGRGDATYYGWTEYKYAD